MKNLSTNDNGREKLPNRTWVDWIVAYEAHLARGVHSHAQIPLDMSEDDLRRLSDARRALDALHVAFGKGHAAAKRCAAEPPSQLGDFQIVGEIGRGGMGVVYEAEQLSMGRQVALKILPTAATLDQKRLDRFHNEVRAAATLDHPHCVPIYAVGEERGVHYYAMKLVRGQSLARVIEDLQTRESLSNGHGKEVRSPRRLISFSAANSNGKAAGSTVTSVRGGADQPNTGTISVSHSARKREYFRRVAELGTQAAEALHHAHEQGVVHRDVKPGNLLLDSDGMMWVTDFGLARVEADAGVTMTGDLLGTLRYMSPEQALGKRALVDHRVDIYSLGATLYELLTLQPAIHGDERGQMLRQFADLQPAPPRKIDPSIPVELETIIMKAMEADPVDRFATAAEFADDLRRFLANEPIRARRSTATERVIKWVRRYPAWAALFAVIMLSMSALTMGTIWHASRLSRELVVNEKLRSVAQKQQAEMRRSRYLLDMQLAGRSIADGQYADARHRLEFYVPPSEFSIDRDFPWYYLWKKCSEAVKSYSGHSGMVRSVVVAQQAGLLVSGGDDSTVRIFDLETGEPAAVLNDFAGNVHAVEVTPDERTLVTAGEDGELLLWKMDSVCEGNEPPQPFRLDGHGEDVLCVAVSMDGKHLASAGAGGEIRLWELSSGELVGRWEQHVDWVRDLEFSPDGKTLASISHDDYLILWDVEAGVARSRVKVVDGHPLGLCVTFHPSGQWLATGSSTGEVQILDFRNLKTISTYRLPTSWIRSLDFSKDGQFLALSGNDPFVHILRVDSHLKLKPWHTLHGHQPETWCVQFLADRSAVLSSGNNGKILLRSIESGRQLKSEKSSYSHRISDPTHEMIARRLSVSSDRNKVLLASACFTQIAEHDSSQHVPQLSTRTVFKKHSKSYTSIISPDGCWIGLVYWNAIRLSPVDSVSRRWWVKGAKEELPMPRFSTLAFHPFEPLIAVGTNAGEAELLNLPSGELVAKRRPFEKTRVTDVFFAADGRLIAACFCELHASQPAIAIVWDADSMQESHRIEGVERILAVSPDGDRLALVNCDRSIQLWNLKNRTTEVKFAGHGDIIVSGDFSPNGKYFMSTARTGPIKLWSTESSQLVLDIDEDLVLPQVVFTSDNSAVASTIQLPESIAAGEKIHKLVFLVDGEAGADVQPASD